MVCVRHAKQDTRLWVSAMKPSKRKKSETSTEQLGDTEVNQLTTWTVGYLWLLCFVTLTSRICPWLLNAHPALLRYIDVHCEPYIAGISFGWY